MLDVAAPSLPSADAPFRESSESGLPRPDIARVESHASADAVLDAWSELEGTSEHTPYQSRGWLRPWIDTIGAQTGIRPLFIVAYDGADRPLALLPMGVWTKPLVSIATFLGGKDSNFNMGLFRRGLAWTGPDVLQVLREGARAAPLRPDLFVLRNQPLQWGGSPNPFATIAGQPSPSFAYKASLTPDPEVFFKQGVSRDSRKKLRQKTNRLRALGTVEHRMARSAEEIAAVLDAFFEQRSIRFRTQGLPFDDHPLLRAFLDRATARDGGDPAVEFHALFCGDRIVATFGGVQGRRRFCGMVTSFTSDPEMVRMSTGELLLAAVIRAKCLQGCGTLDLGVGEARYKDTYCPEAEPLFESVVPLNALGAAFAFAETVRIAAKRSIKQSAWAWTWSRRLRRAAQSIRPRRAPADGT